MGRIRLAKAKPQKRLIPIEKYPNPKNCESGITLKIKVNQPTYSPDFTLNNMEYWFSCMKKRDMRFPDYIYIMHICPRTNLVMTLNSGDVSTKDANGIMQHAITANGWIFESEAVQCAYTGYLAERTLLGV
jgi:hypothetical protein